MNIGDVAKRSGLPAQTMRYCEDIGLIRPHRTDNGYRTFREADMPKLAFLARARSLGFTSYDLRPIGSPAKIAGTESRKSAAGSRAQQMAETARFS